MLSVKDTFIDRVDCSLKLLPNDFLLVTYDWEHSQWEDGICLFRCGFHLHRAWLFFFFVWLSNDCFPKYMHCSFKFKLGKIEWPLLVPSVLCYSNFSFYRKVTDRQKPVLPGLQILTGLKRLIFDCIICSRSTQNSTKFSSLTNVSLWT